MITDTHWGVKNDHVAFLNSTKNFLDTVFFPYLKDNDINTVVHLGDIVDRRKYINYYTLKRLREDFLAPIQSMGLDFHIIAGNHDTYYKNTNEINAIIELIQDKYPTFKLYDNVAQEVVFDDTKILMVPWICDDNKKETSEIIKTTNAKIVMGHLEIQGFEMYRGSPTSHGEDRGNYSPFSHVFSGHFHHRSTDGSIFYLGSHMEFTWSDFDDPKGFHIFDTKTKRLTFIKNPYIMFKKIWYNDLKENFSLDNIDFSEYKDCILKVIIQEKTNHFLYDKFIERIEAVNPVEMQIVEDHLNLTLEDDETIVNEAESTLSIFRKSIGFMDIKVDKTRLENKIIELYNEALTLQ